MGPQILLRPRLRLQENGNGWRNVEVRREWWGPCGREGGLLRGEAEYALDEKGRVVIPPRFRAALGDRVIVTRWIDPCLAVFSPVAWQSLEEKLRDQPLRNRDFVRLLLSAAEDCDLDRQGRIFLAPHLRDHAGITRGVTIIGMGVRLELWSTPTWRRRLREVAKAPESLAKHLQELIL
jgi:MraZ protein